MMGWDGKGFYDDSVGDFYATCTWAPDGIGLLAVRVLTRTLHQQMSLWPCHLGNA